MSTIRTGFLLGFGLYCGHHLARSLDRALGDVMYKRSSKLREWRAKYYEDIRTNDGYKSVMGFRD